MEQIRRTISSEFIFIAAISAGGNEKSCEDFAPLLSGFDKVSRNDIKALEEKINNETAAVRIYESNDRRKI